MTGKAERLLLVLLVALLVVAPEDGGAARTAYDANGTFLIDGAKAFPIVLTLGPPVGGLTPAGTDGLDEVTAAGVNVLRAGPFGEPFTEEALADAQAMNRAAAARNVYTWVNLRELARAKPDTTQEETLKKVVTTLAGDPALAFWKGADEPQWVGWPASDLTHAYCLTTSRGDASWCDQTRSLDPWHLWVTIQAPRGTPADLAPYSLVTDSHGVNVYPVGIRTRAPDLHEVGRWTKTIESVTPNRVVWTTLQICSSGSIDGYGGYVLPTHQQERYMIYDAIINGARALNFFGGQVTGCFNASDAALGWNWTFWNSVLKPLVLEIGPRSDLYRALLEPGSALPLTTDDPFTQVTSRQVGGEIWVIAARHGSGTASVQIGGLPADGVTASVYTEGRSVAVTGGAIRDTFGEWGVHVYRFPAVADAAGPDTWIASGPSGSIRERTALFTFGSSRGARFECALDARQFAPCSSPSTYTNLSDGAHRVRVRAVDAAGRVDTTPAVRDWTIDGTAPRPAVAAPPRFQRRASVPVRWSAAETGSGVESYDVRYREAAANVAFGPFVSWRNATATTTASLPANPGSTYCFSARARDRVGNVSAWSRGTCTAIPLDDATLAAKGRWKRVSHPSYFLGTYSVSAARGAALVARGIRAKRIAVVVTKCPACGTARILWNGRRLRDVPLKGSTRIEVIEVASFAAVRTGTIAVRVVSPRKRVYVDAVGASLR